MACHLLLMRHAKSDWKVGADDFERPLAKRGRKACRRIGKWLSQQPHRPEIVLCSPAERARRTALAVVPFIEFPARQIEWNERLYGAGKTTLVEQIRAIDDDFRCALLIAHNPGLEDLLLALCGQPSRDGRIFPTAALAVLKLDSWRSVTDSSTRLTAMALPRLLAD